MLVSFAVRRALLVAGVLACLASTAGAQEFPSRPLRLIVPWPAGGGPDIAARIVAEHLGQRLARAVVVDNRVGATGRIGTEAVAKGDADGYTLALANVSTHVLPVAGGLRLAYDPVRDFAPVGLIGGSPGVLVVHTGVPAQNLKELIALAKASPGKLTFASPGTGSGFHITAEMFKGAAGIDILHVPFKGAAPALTEVLGGRVDMVFDQLGALAQVAAGKLRAIATTGPKRWSAAPEVPTMDEAGIKGFEALSWVGIFVPAATPAPVVVRLARDLGATLNSPEVRKALLDRGVEPMPGTPEDLRARQMGDIERWGRAIREARIVIE